MDPDSPSGRHAATSGALRPAGWHLRTRARTRRFFRPGNTNVAQTSADRLVDEATGEPYFRARVEVAQEALAALGEDVVLSPGMPVEVMIATGEQTVIDYVAGPLLRSFNRAFREQ